jgi:hypothetical protein
MRIFQNIVCLSFLFISFAINAQSTVPQESSLDGGTIESQFDYLYKKSPNYQEYEMIKTFMARKIKANVLDSLVAMRSSFKEAQNTITAQQNQITTLKVDLASTNENLSNITNEKDSISFFGVLMNKAGYKALMWGIVAILCALLGLFVYKYRNSNYITQESRKNLAEMEEEFETHRSRALEREQKVRRQLQDEINKQKTAKAK